VPSRYVVAELNLEAAAQHSAGQIGTADASTRDKNTNPSSG
jgi:hypothetical protein